MLAGDPSKSWNITFASSDKDESDESCKAVNAFTADNEWIFKKNGDFEFNNGSTYEIANCPNCNCIDLAHLVGQWTLSSQDTLLITANGRIETNGKITSFDEEEVAKFKIASITATEMIANTPPNVSVKFMAK